MRRRWHEHPFAAARWWRRYRRSLRGGDVHVGLRRECRNEQTDSTRAPPLPLLQRRIGTLQSGFGKVLGKFLIFADVAFVDTAFVDIALVLAIVRCEKLQLRAHAAAGGGQRR